MPLDIHNQEQLGALYRRKEALRAMIYRRAVVAYWRAMGNAGPVPETAKLDMCVMHNSMIDFERGRPWREIDYSAMRLAIRIQEKTFEPDRISAALFDRRWRETYRRAA